jgi:cobalt/nickel transport system permease protein
MHVDLFDRYDLRNSLVHAMDPRTKVILTVLFILSNVLLPDGAWPAFGLSFGLVLAASELSRLGIFYTVKRSFVALPFALAAVTAIFAIPGQPVAAFSLGPWDLVATGSGLARFGSIVVRSWLSVQMAILLAATTQFPDLIHALRHLRVPSVLVAIVSFMYRYLFVLSDEALRLLRARESRSARLAKAGQSIPLKWRAKVAGNMAGQLFLRSYERSDRIYSAMQARGFSGQLLTLNPHELTPWDWLTGAIFLLILVAFQVLARLLV